jgi:hypothetical protein
MDRGALRLRSTGGAIVEARRVNFGDLFGPERARRHMAYEPRIEFVAVGRIRDRHLATYPDAHRLEGLVRAGFAPGDEAGFDLSRGEAERLRAWLRDPLAASAEATTALVVGADRDLERAGVALARLRLEPIREVEAHRALGQLERAPATLVLVGQDVVGAHPLAFVRGLRKRAATRDIPVVGVGGEADAALAAGADGHVPAPLDGAALVAAAAEVLELV